MKPITAGALLALGSTVAAKDTLIDMDNARAGGFGGPVVKIGPVYDTSSVMLGGEGAATFTAGEHSLFIGGGGYGLVNAPDFGSEDKLEMGYGGLIIGYTHRPDQLIHVETKLLLGFGGVTVVNLDGDRQDDASFFASEISITGEANLTDFFEIGVGAAYRQTSQPNIDRLKARDLSGPSMVVTFQFGSI
ncbi:MAG: hypothetical protein ACX931_07880 [Saccharospirillum sp.]